MKKNLMMMIVMLSAAFIAPVYAAAPREREFQTLEQEKEWEGQEGIEYPDVPEQEEYDPAQECYSAQNVAAQPAPPSSQPRSMKSPETGAALRAIEQARQARNQELREQRAQEERKREEDQALESATQEESEEEAKEEEQKRSNFSRYGIEMFDYLKEVKSEQHPGFIPPELISLMASYEISPWLDPRMNLKSLFLKEDVEILNLTITPDSKKIVIYFDRTLKMGGRLLSPSGISTMQTRSLQEPEQEIQTYIFPGNPYIRAVSPDGKFAILTRIYQSSKGKDESWIADVKTDDKIPLEFSPYTPRVGWSPITIITPDNKLLAYQTNANTICIANMRTGKLIKKLIIGDSDNNVRTIAISPDKKLLATGSDDQAVRIWDIKTGDLVHTLTGHTGPVRAVAISPDGQRLATGSDDKTVRIWDIESGALVHILTGHTGAVRAVAISPDGQWLATGSDDKTVRIWDMKTGALARKPLEEYLCPVTAVAISPDGQWLVTGCDYQTIRIWSLVAPQQEQRRLGPTVGSHAIEELEQEQWTDNESGNEGYGYSSQQVSEDDAGQGSVEPGWEGFEFPEED